MNKERYQEIFDDLIESGVSEDDAYIQAENILIDEESGYTDWAYEMMRDEQ